MEVDYEFVAQYDSDGDGYISDSEVENATADWTAGRITTDQLNMVIYVWKNHIRIPHTTPVFTFKGSRGIVTLKVSGIRYDSNTGSYYAKVGTEITIEFTVDWDKTAPVYSVEGKLMGYYKPNGAILRKSYPYLNQVGDGRILDTGGSDLLYQEFNQEGVKTYTTTIKMPDYVLTFTGIAYVYGDTWSQNLDSVSVEVLPLPEVKCDSEHGNYIWCGVDTSIPSILSIVKRVRPSKPSIWGRREVSQNRLTCRDIADITYDGSRTRIYFLIGECVNLREHSEASVYADGHVEVGHFVWRSYGTCGLENFKMRIKKMPSGSFIGKLCASIAAFLNEVGIRGEEWTQLANWFGVKVSFDSESFEVICEIDESVLEDYNRAKEYYYKINSLLSELNEAVEQAYKDCMKYKAKLYESGYVAENSWKMYLQQNIGGLLEKVKMYLEYYRAAMDNVLNHAVDWYCIRQQYPEATEVVKYYMGAPSLPAECHVQDGEWICSIDCDVPRIHVEDVNFGYNLLEFRAWADVEMTVLFDVVRKEGEKEELVDSFTLNLTTEEKWYRVEINTPVGGMYCLTTRYGKDYFNPICKVLEIVNVSISDVKYTTEGDKAVISAKVTVDFPCKLSIGLFYEDGTLITSKTLSLSPDTPREVMFVVDLNEVNHRTVCVAPLGVEDITATRWKLIL